MFGYKCPECSTGTVRATTLETFEVRFENVPFEVREAVIGVCDECGARHFDGRERRRWRRLFDQRRGGGRAMEARAIRQLRADLGLSRAGFAALIGATRQSLHQWENDDRAAPQSRMVDNMLWLLRQACDEGKVDVAAALMRLARDAGIELGETTAPGSESASRRGGRGFAPPADFDGLFGYAQPASPPSPSLTLVA